MVVAFGIGKGGVSIAVLVNDDELSSEVVGVADDEVDDTFIAVVTAVVVDVVASTPVISIPGPDSRGTASCP